MLTKIISIIVPLLLIISEARMHRYASFGRRSSYPYQNVPGNRRISDYIKNPRISDYSIKNPGISDYNIKNPAMLDYSVRSPGLSDYSIGNPGFSNYYDYSVRSPGLSDYSVRNPGFSNYYDSSNMDISNYGIRNPGFPNYDYSSFDISNYGINNPGVSPLSYNYNSNSNYFGGSNDYCAIPGDIYFNPMESCVDYYVCTYDNHWMLTACTPGLAFSRFANTCVPFEMSECY